jgi:hypothetical protein
MRKFKVLLLTTTLVVGTFEFGTRFDDRDRLLAAEAFQQYLDRMNELDRMIKAEIGEPRATDLSQCRSIPFGAKACGGPATYLAYSVARTNDVQLRALVDEFNQTAREYNQARKLMSDCMFVSEPKVELIEGICKLQWNQPVPIE